MTGKAAVPPYATKARLEPAKRRGLLYISDLFALFILHRLGLPCRDRLITNRQSCSRRCMILDGTRPASARTGASNGTKGDGIEVMFQSAERPRHRPADYRSVCSDADSNALAVCSSVTKVVGSRVAMEASSACSFSGPPEISTRSGVRRKRSRLTEMTRALTS